MSIDKILKLEQRIEDAHHQAGYDGNHENEFRVYEEIQNELTALQDLDELAVKERDRVLSHCLLRMADALSEVEEDFRELGLVKEALSLAKRSENQVQIARSLLALGIRILNQGNLPEAEECFTQIIEMAKDNTDRDMVQVLGFTFLVRSNILLGKSLYNQAVFILKEAEYLLSSIDNYRGLAAVHRVLARAHASLGEAEESEAAKKMADYYEEKV